MADSQYGLLTAAEDTLYDHLISTGLSDTDARAQVIGCRVGVASLIETPEPARWGAIPTAPDPSLAVTLPENDPVEDTPEVLPDVTDITAVDEEVE